MVPFEEIQHQAFLEERSLYEDYFLNLNAGINFNFSIDLFECLFKKTGLTSKDAENVTRIPCRAVHSR